MEDRAREEMCRRDTGASFDDIIRSMQEEAVRKARSSLSVTKSHVFNRYFGYSDTNKAIAMHVDEEDKLNDKTSSSLGQRGG